MPCPFAELRGFLSRRVYCKIQSKFVNHKKYGCLDEGYTRCPFYVDYITQSKSSSDQKADEKGEKFIAPDINDVKEEKDIMEKMINDNIKKISTYGDPKKGIYPDTCYDCLYFSPTTRLCVLLRIKVKDPEKPPCKQGQRI